MKRHLTLNCTLVLALIFSSCKKEKDTVVDCFPNTSVARLVINKPASIALLGSQFYIIEQNTIDTRLAPCNLASEFMVDKLLITVSGTVKSSFTSSVGPCCTENFVISKITR